MFLFYESKECRTVVASKNSITGLDETSPEKQIHAPCFGSLPRMSFIYVRVLSGRTLSICRSYPLRCPSRQPAASFQFGAADALLLKKLPPITLGKAGA